MKRLRITSSIALVLAAFVFGFFLFQVFKSCQHQSLASQKRSVPVESLQRQAIAKERAYQKQIALLENKTEQLTLQLSATQEQLASVKVKAKKRESSIRKIIAPKGLAATELLAKTTAINLVDSSGTPCDSLVREVNEYLKVNMQKDSLYENQIATLDSMLSVKDSVIQFKTHLHTQWAEFFSRALDEQDILRKENQQLQKQFKRQKQRSKLATLGLMMLTAVGTNYLLKH